MNRILEWYRTGVNPQNRLPFLATYLGHRDIHSTLVYITVTQDLLHYANERFRVGGRAMPQPGTGGATMSRANPFPELMRAFFYEWLVEQRNASVHTVRSYRDTWRLFLRFVAQRAGKKVAMIVLADLAASEVTGFLEARRTGTWRHDRDAQLPACRDPQLLQLRGDQGSRINRAVRRDPQHPCQAGAGIGTLLSGSGRGGGDPCPARPFDTRRHARSRVALIPLQQRGTDTGGA
ncbi:MAG: hypothetical protein WDN69_21795 [Aliidongia sp.]